MKVRINHTLDLDPDQVKMLRQHYNENKAEGESFRDMIKWYFIADGEYHMQSRIQSAYRTLFDKYKEDN